MSFEEVTALNSAADRLISVAGEGSVLAPPECMVELETRLPLEGDLSIMTRAEQHRLLGAVELVLDHLRRRMDALILEQYVGSDDSVNAYFDYANVLTTRDRLAGMGREMDAIMELIDEQGTASDGELTFPD
jgi:hypothetical protein